MSGIFANKIKFNIQRNVSEFYPIIIETSKDVYPLIKNSKNKNIIFLPPSENEIILPGEINDYRFYEGDSDLKIWIDFNPDHKTVTIRDNGIGMSLDDVVENLGTIAKSGTRAFREMLTGDNAKDSQLIGQFGVGFYSAFIVADKVVVKTRKAGMAAEQGVHWESDGKGEYTVKHATKQQRGTEIILYVKEDQEEYLDN